MSIEKLQNALIQGIVMGIPGLSVAIGSSSDLFWAGTAGYSDLFLKVPLKTSDRFGIGSITKTFVARVIFQLVEEGKLKLDQRAIENLDQELVKHIPNIDKATVRQLLNHQSGIPTWEFQKDWIRKARGDLIRPGKTWGKTETLEFLKDQSITPNHEPGEKYSYSNTNYTILGLLIEATTGNSTAAEIRQRLLDPLKMEDTFFESFEDIPGGFVNHYHFATPIFAASAGIHQNFPEIRPYLIETTAANLSCEWTAGGMVSSARDLLRWAQAIQTGELLNPASHKEIFRHYPPLKSEDSRETYLQGIQKIKSYYKDQTAYGHSGGTLGFTAKMFWLDKAGITIVLLTNVGEMHSGLNPAPVGLFFREILLPVAMECWG